jgi:sporulation protein YlmC with PRC-barrel domain
MKPKYLLRLSMLSACALWQALPAAQETETAPRLNEVKNEARPADADEPYSIRSARATELMGLDVRSADGAGVATIEDFVLDIENGRIVHVVLSGNQVGEGRVEVPARAFDYTRDQRAVRWEGKPEQLKKAPRFSAPGSNRPAQATHAAEVYTYYNEDPYFTVDNATSPKVPNNVHTHGQPANVGSTPVKLGRVVLASDLIGEDINNAGGEKIASVKDLIIDLRAGRVIAVIIGGGGFLGIGEAQNAVPPAAFSYASDDTTALRLTATRDTVRKSPRYKAGDATRFDDPGYTDEIYRSFEQEPYTRLAGADNTRTNRRDREGATLTPIDQSNAKGDVDTTARIRKAILASEGLSVNAQNVKIITRDNVITLRGPVKTPAEKSIIGEIAAREGSAFLRVDNQLEVAGE